MFMRLKILIVAIQSSDLRIWGPQPEALQHLFHETLGKFIQQLWMLISSPEKWKFHN